MKSYRYLTIAALGLGLYVAGCSVTSDSDMSYAREPLTSGGGSATLTYSSDWNSGYCANVAVSNTGSATSTSWTVVVELNQATLTTSWNATVAQSGTRLTLTPASWNAVLAAGASTTFGFCGAATGTNYHPTIVSVSVTGGPNGTGGASGTGGSKSTGGASGTGGSKSTGGSSSVGGAKSTGGSGGSGGAGGSGGTGGSSLPAANAKDPSLYGQRDVFLVSDSDWRRVFTSVPAAIWTEAGGVTQQHPLLVFHDERAFTGLNASSAFFRFNTGFLDVDVQVPTTSLTPGKAVSLTVSLINRSNEVRVLAPSIGRRNSEIAVTATQVRVFDMTTQYLLTQLDGTSFTLQPNETRTFAITVTLSSSFSGGFDAEAALHFLGEYGTGVASPRLHVFETLPNELQAALPPSWVTVQHTDPTQLWKSIRDVVYVPNDYQLAMAAAPYAALINAPLLIQAYNDNLDLSSRHVTCIGLTQAACTETLSLDQLRRRYLQATNTNKVILTRPVTDIVAVDTLVAPPATRGVMNLFGASSLVAPILAAAKQELILSVDAQAADTVDAQLDALLADLALKPRYLTIIASPLEIQQTITIFRQETGISNKWSIDSTKYGNLDNDTGGFAEAKTGRIYGLTSGDTSTYVARAIFHTDLPRLNTDQYLFIGQGASSAYDGMADAFAALFSARGSAISRTYANPTVPADWANRTLINDSAHGNVSNAAIDANDLPWLSNTVFLSASCLTCAFDYLTSDMSHFFCLQLLRRGALGAVVSVDTNGFVWDGTRLNKALGSDLGAVIKAQQNYDKARVRWYEDVVAGTHDYTILAGDIQFLLGDPTVSMGSSGPMLPDSSAVITPVAGGLSLDVTVPSITMQGPDQYLFMEGMDDFHSASFGVFFAPVGPMPLSTASVLASPDVEPAYYGGIHLVATHDDIDGKYWYLMFGKNLSANPAGVVTTNKIHVNVTQ